MNEHSLQFFKDADGSYAANIRLYDPAVLGNAAASKVSFSSRPFDFEGDFRDLAATSPLKHS